MPRTERKKKALHWLLLTLAQETVLCSTFIVICKTGLPLWLGKWSKAALRSHLHVGTATAVSHLPEAHRHLCPVRVWCLNNFFLFFFVCFVLVIVSFLLLCIVRSNSKCLAVSRISSDCAAAVSFVKINKLITWKCELSWRPSFDAPDSLLYSSHREKKKQPKSKINE